jgi:outer membrane protein assembly factor BamA
MGGIDDWLLPKFNANIVVDKTQNYVYQTLATNMRGFTQNIRNGNNFVVLNSELRFPIIACLISKPMKSWLQNFQVVGFVDFGSAWVGINPWSKDNAIYKETKQIGNLTVEITKELEPFVGGIGFGIRTELFGYDIRVDRGYGVENGRLNQGVWYLSIGIDF